MKQTKVILVCGPPCSGKSTYVMAHWTQGDLIFDYDRVMEAVTNLPSHERCPYAFDFVNVMRDAFYRRAEPGRHSGTIWIIEGAPQRSRREELMARFGAELVLLLPPVEELLSRAEQRGPNWPPIVKDWLSKHEAWG